MDINLKEMKVTVTLEEMVDIINGREKAAKMDTIMPSGKENPLSVSYNDGVKVMAKYIRDWFGNRFDEEQIDQYKKGGEW